MGYYSSYFVYVLPALILALYAQSKVNSTFNKYSKVYSKRGVTASDVAANILLLYGVTDVRVERVGGNLTDHYDPKQKVLRLSDSVYDSTSVASIGVAAHEAGHAIQHSEGYFPIKLRNSVLPVANIGSTLAFPLALIGLIFSFGFLIELGIILFSAVVAFQVITLPVEFNASNRAVKILSDNNMLDDDERDGATKVLKAAALTYIAAAAVSLANLLRLMSFRSRD